jgi:hypothetical protein
MVDINAISSLETIAATSVLLTQNQNKMCQTHVLHAWSTPLLADLRE